MPPLRFAVGQLVRVHVMALGTVVDLHTPTWVGHGYTLNGQRSETVQMAPGGMLSTDVMMTSPGEFQGSPLVSPAPRRWRRRTVHTSSV